MNKTYFYKFSYIKNMEISACLIVKNEEEVLARCLNCIKIFADEIIVVDTGSTDKTKEIAKRYTKHVYDFKWNDNFSDARNFSFSKATKDYVMWLDADDIIKQKEVEKLLKLKQCLTASTYMLKYAIAFNEKGEATFSYFRERILKRNDFAKWKGFVHEAISPFGKIEYLDIVIEHHKVKNTNTKRNLKIYNKHLKNGEVLLTREQYYYSKELFYNKFYKKCIKEIKKYLKMPNKFEPNIVDSYLTMAKCYIFTNSKDKALNCLLNSLKDIPPNSEILCEIGNIFVNKSKFIQAIFFYEFATTIQPNYNSGQFIDNNYYYFFPYIQLTMLYYKTGNYEKAKKYHQLCKHCNPNHTSVIYNEQFFS